MRYARAKNEARSFILGSLNSKISWQEERDKIDFFYSEEYLAKQISSPKSSFDYYSPDILIK